MTFKFFRKYNKIILVIGAAFLMVAFLIQGVVQMFYGSPGDLPVGTINDGVEVTRNERTAANNELKALQFVDPVLGSMAAGVAEGDGLKWLLMVRDAQRLGLNASQGQVNQVLHVVGMDDAKLQQISARTGLNPDFVRLAVRHWIMLHQYQALMMGQQNTSPVQMAQVANFLTQARSSGNYGLYIQALQLARQTQGSVRLSEPLIQWFVNNRKATVSGSALIIDASHYLDDIQPPTESDLQSLFEQYHDDLPGQSEPYGFGYKYPDRVKIEWLAFPVYDLRDHVQVQYYEVLEYYQTHQDQFRRQPQPQTQPGTQPSTQPQPQQPQVQPFSAVQDQIEQHLRNQKAAKLARKMAHAAQARFLAEVRRLPDEGRYVQIPDDYQPVSLEEVASALQEEFGVKPEVHRYQERWVATADLSRCSASARRMWSIGRMRRSPPMSACAGLSIRPRTTRWWAWACKPRCPASRWSRATARITCFASPPPSPATTPLRWMRCVSRSRPTRAGSVPTASWSISRTSGCSGR